MPRPKRHNTHGNLQEYAAEVLAEEDDGRAFPADHDADAPGRAELRRQLEECGLQVASASASGLVDRAREAEREQRLLGVLARLRRERDERLLRLAEGQGLVARFMEEEQEQEVAGVPASTSSATVNSTHTDLTRATTRHAGALMSVAVADATHERTPPASPPSSPAADPAAAAASASEQPTPLSPLPPSQPPAATTLAERIQASRAFLGGALGELALRRADEVAAAARGAGAGDMEARLASEVFVGGKAKYLGVFLHVRALEAWGRSKAEVGQEGRAGSP